MGDYSKRIAGLVKRFLDGDNWNYDFKEEKGLFTFNLSLDCKLGKVNYQVRIDKDSYIVLAFSPMSADESCRTQMAEFITRANYGLKNGNFEMDFRDGELRYKCYVNCDGTDPGTEIIKDSILVPAAMFKRYAGGIVAVLFGMQTPEQAVKEAEKDM